MHYLSLFGDSATPYRLTLERDVQGCLARANGLPIRTSPIFPVSNEPSRPYGEITGFVGLFCPLDAYSFISRQPPTIKKLLWFTLGLAAVVRFSDDAAELKDFATSAGDALAAYEIWDVRPSLVSVVTSHIRKVKPEPCQLAHRDLKSKDHRRLVEELQLNFHEAVRCAAVYMPEQLPRFRRLVGAVDELTADLAQLEKDLSKNNRSEDLTPFRLINHAVSQLIQLNSALAYVVSQATYGAPPILECPCLISAHSLLGVGTAYRAIISASNYVEKVFEKFSVIGVIDEKYRTTAPFDIFLHLPDFDPVQWRNTRLGVDLHLPTTNGDACSKVAYFSSRLGFSESTFCVTAAVQVLHGADSARWSLMTITHELLHAHVAGVLATIFSENVSQGLTAKRFAELHSEFTQFSRSDPRGHPTSTVQSLRFAIFNFTVWRNNAYAALKIREVAKRNGNPITGPVRAPGAIDTLHEFFNQSLRLLEELIVHTLDLRYFYCSDRDLYIRSLWESWTTVPAVVGDIETYLLRSLAASATLESGALEDRLDRSIAHLKSVLSTLAKVSTDNGFITRAVGYLDSEECVARIRIVFRPCVYICDLVRIFLSSGKIESKFWAGDENIEALGSGIPSYQITPSAFDGVSIKNPIALLANRLKEGFGKPDESEDHRSAWLLVAVASTAGHAHE